MSSLIISMSICFYKKKDIGDIKLTFGNDFS